MQEGKKASAHLLTKDLFFKANMQYTGIYKPLQELELKLEVVSPC